MKLFVTCLAVLPFFLCSQERTVVEIAESYRNISFAEAAAYSAIEADLESFSGEVSVYKKSCTDIKHVAKVEKQYKELMSFAKGLNEWNPFFDESFSKNEIQSPQEKYIVGVVKLMPLLVTMRPLPNLDVPNSSVLRSNLYESVTGREISKAKLEQYRREIEGLEKNISFKNYENTMLLPNGKPLSWLNARIENTKVLLRSLFEFHRLLEAKNCNIEKIIKKRNAQIRFNPENLMSALHSLHIEMARQRISFVKAHKEIWQAINQAKISKHTVECEENMPSLEGAKFLLAVKGLTDYKHQPLATLSYLSDNLLNTAISINNLIRHPSELYETACNRLVSLAAIENKLKNKEKLSDSDRETLNKTKARMKIWNEEKSFYFKNLKITLDSHSKIYEWLNAKNRRQEVRKKFIYKLKEENRFSEASLERLLREYDVFVGEFPEIIEQEKTWIHSLEEQFDVLLKKISESQSLVNSV